MKIAQKFDGYFKNLHKDRADENRLLLGQILLEEKRRLWDSDMKFTPSTWDEFGFKVFSQSNEDGLIQYLIRKVDIPNKTFIEFGVSDYAECNTRFLLLNNNWSGFVMDGSEANIEGLINSSIYWQHDIKARAAFITKENINGLLEKSGFDKEVGILSIDIDGNDYWIWENINCINPRIVICEYNPIYGRDICVSVPYDKDFYRTDKHYSNLYWGASLGAYADLAKRKNYKLVCVNQMGHNAFFVRNDVAESLPEVSVMDAYRKMSYRESRDENGKLTYLSQTEGLKLIENEMVIDVSDGKPKSIKECMV